MLGTDLLDAGMLRRITQRLEELLQAARERERKGQCLAVDIDARLRLEDQGALQFQLASVILEELQGMRQEEVVGELLSLGLATVLERVARIVGPDAAVDGSGEPMLRGDSEPLVLAPCWGPRGGSRVVN